MDDVGHRAESESRVPCRLGAIAGWSSNRRARAAPCTRDGPRSWIRWPTSSGGITSTPIYLCRTGSPWLPLAATGAACSLPTRISICCFSPTEKVPRLRTRMLSAPCARICGISGSRLSPTTRTLDDCDRLHRDNPEFNISLLDCRLLAGDYGLFRRLHDQVIPRSVLRDWQELVLAAGRGQRSAAPSGGRHHLPSRAEHQGRARRIARLQRLLLAGAAERLFRARDWTDAFDYFPASLRDRAQEAKDFLVSVRCFLHYRAGRDDNQLNWEAQQAAAEAHIGYDGGAADAAEWMRYYYRQARVINRLFANMVDEVVPARSSLFQQFQNWRSRLSTDEFSCVNGRVLLQQPSALISPENFFNCFEFVAQHGLKLAASTELRIEQALPAIAAMDLSGPQRWAALRKVLVRPHAAKALRIMQELGVLGLLLPEFRAVESLVIRDYYHRYTVDEHTFRAVDSIHKLASGKKERQSQTLPIWWKKSNAPSC